MQTRYEGELEQQRHAMEAEASRQMELLRREITLGFEAELNQALQRQQVGRSERREWAGRLSRSMSSVPPWPPCCRFSWKRNTRPRCRSSGARWNSTRSSRQR